MTFDGIVELFCEIEFEVGAKETLRVDHEVSAWLCRPARIELHHFSYDRWSTN